MIKRLTSLKSYVTVWWDWLPTLQNIFLMLLSLPFPLWSEPCGPTDVVRKRREYKSNSMASVTERIWRTCYHLQKNRRGPTGTRDRRRDHKEDIISLETAEWRWGTSQSEAVRMWWDFLPRRDKRIEDKGSPTNQGSYAATPIQSSLRLGFHGLLSILWSFPSSF